MREREGPFLPASKSSGSGVGGLVEGASGRADPDFVSGGCSTVNVVLSLDMV